MGLILLTLAMDDTSQWIQMSRQLSMLLQRLETKALKMFSALLHNKFSLLSFNIRICRELQNVWMHCKARVTNVKHSMYHDCLCKRWKIPSKWHTYVCAWNTCMSRAHVQPHLTKSMIWWQDSICITVYNNIFSVIHGSNIILQSNHVSNTYSTYTCVLIVHKLGTYRPGQLLLVLVMKEVLHVTCWKS